MWRSRPRRRPLVSRPLAGHAQERGQSPCNRREWPLLSAAVKAKVVVMPKKSVLDPQGVAVRDAVHHHGMPEVQSIRIGKFMEIELQPGGDIEERLHEMCRDLLSNPVIEDYQLIIEE